MTSNPLVSVVIPVYNRDRYLAETLDSVFAQTYRPIEVIVIDDGSTDNSAEVARAYPEVCYLYQSNQGAAAARNTGVATAQGEVIAFLDADDTWKPNKLSLQVEYLNQHSQVGILATHVHQFLVPDAEISVGVRYEKLLGDQPGMLPSTLAIRKIVFDQIGRFDAKFVSCEDTEWLCRARDSQVEIAMMPEVLAMRRLHGSNLSTKMASTASVRLLKILKASIDRKSQAESRS